MAVDKKCCKCRKPLTAAVCRACGHAACNCAKCRDCAHDGCPSIVCARKRKK